MKMYRIIYRDNSVSPWSSDYEWMKASYEFHHRRVILEEKEFEEVKEDRGGENV